MPHRVDATPRTRHTQHGEPSPAQHGTVSLAQHGTVSGVRHQCGRRCTRCGSRCTQCWRVLPSL